MGAMCMPTNGVGDLGASYMPTNRVRIWGCVHACQWGGDLGVSYMPTNGVGIWGLCACLPMGWGSRGLVHVMPTNRAGI